MQNAAQPQTNDRDTSVQIRGAVERWPVDSLLAGVKADVLEAIGADNWVCESVLANAVADDLACLIKMLTSCVKSEREWAKKRVRELVKLGGKAAK